MKIFAVDNPLQVVDGTFQFGVFDVDQVANMFEMLLDIFGIEVFQAEEFNGVDRILYFDIVGVMQLREGNGVAKDFRFRQFFTAHRGRCLMHRRHVRHFTDDVL